MTIPKSGSGPQLKNFGASKTATEPPKVNPYYKDCQVISRKIFDTQDLTLIPIMGGMMPMRTHGVETKNEKFYNVACQGFDSETEEYNTKPCALCSLGYTSSCAYLMLVFVVEWATNPGMNPKPNLGPVAVLEMPREVLEGVISVQKAWNIENICIPEQAQTALKITRSKAGNKVSYQVQGVPNRTPYQAITNEYVMQMQAAGSCFIWDLAKYLESKYSDPAEMLQSLTNHGYYETMAECDTMANAYITSGHFPEFAYTDVIRGRCAKNIKDYYPDATGPQSLPGAAPGMGGLPPLTPPGAGGLPPMAPPSAGGLPPMAPPAAMSAPAPMAPPTAMAPPPVAGMAPPPMTAPAVAPLQPPALNAAPALATAPALAPPPGLPNVGGFSPTPLAPPALPSA